MAEAKNVDNLDTVLSRADHTYSKLPQRLRLQVEELVRGLAQYGPRKLNRKGAGMEFIEARDFHPDKDEVKDINWRMSARAGKNIVVEKEAEVRQHFYLWRKGGGSANYSSNPKVLPTVKEATEVMLLAFAKHLARNDELIGVMDRKGTYTGGRVPGNVAHHLQDVNILTGDVPNLHRKLPRNSTVVLFSDFLEDDPSSLVDALDNLQGQGLRGFMVMTLDPEVLEFKKHKGHLEFQDMRNGGITKEFSKAESLQNEYVHRIGQYVNWVQKLARNAGYKFILQRTDQPLSNALLQIYGLKKMSRDHSPEHRLDQG